MDLLELLDEKSLGHLMKLHTVKPPISHWGIIFSTGEGFIGGGLAYFSNVALVSCAQRAMVAAVPVLRCVGVPSTHFFP